LTSPHLRWIAFGLGASAFWLSFFHRVAPGVLAGELTREFDVSGAALGALAATYFYVYAMMQLPSGVWACAKEVNASTYAGMATSVANVGGFLAAGILQPLVGWMLDVSAPGDFRAALAVLSL
jgi:hypothetical protein